MHVSRDTDHRQPWPGRAVLTDPLSDRVLARPVLLRQLLIDDRGERTIDTVVRGELTAANGNPHRPEVPRPRGRLLRVRRRLPRRISVEVERAAPAILAHRQRIDATDRGD